MSFIIDFTKEKLDQLVDFIDEETDSGRYWAVTFIITIFITVPAWFEFWIVYDVLQLPDETPLLRNTSKKLATTAISSLIVGIVAFENSENGFKFRDEFKRKEFAVTFLIGGITFINMISQWIVETIIPNNLVVIPYSGIALVVGYILVHVIEEHYKITNELIPLSTGLLMISLLLI